MNNNTAPVFEKAAFGEMVSTRPLAYTKATNNFGQYCKAAEVQVRVSVEPSVIIETFYGSGRRASGVALSIEDARQLRDLLTAALEVL
jgi:hypothetical protein